MSARYFEKFPIVEYANAAAIDITCRVKVTDATLRGNPYAFYPYEVPDGERVDQLANRYYGDPYMAWLIHHANEIIDPYYGWMLGDADFNAYIVEKHGGIEDPNLRIKHWRVNWESDPTVLSTVAYDALDDELRKYWTQLWDAADRVVGWERAQLDWIINTNMHVMVSIASPANTAYENGELVSFKVAGEVVGRGEVLKSEADGGEVYIINVTDTYPDGSYMVGRDSGANNLVANSTVLVRSIPLSEQVYWSPLTVYDYEDERNQSLRSVYLLDEAFAPQALSELKALLRPRTRR